jgi:hypothetical protein
MEEAITRENIGTLQEIDLTVRNNGFGEDLQV